MYAEGGECFGANIKNHCDEYPFNKSMQGGEANYILGKVSLKLINGSDNSEGGGVFGRMIIQDGTQNNDKFLVFSSPEAIKSVYITRKGKVEF
ncbi:NucA/NucB deoxyribonuclease domain-containing protein [Kingella kingae]|uniref:NucA/NucB deoxyribonuclease domain-containing protein n=2 Tax=Kingella kingae TaxID=504 RepID=UPI003D700EF6